MKSARASQRFPARVSFKVQVPGMPSELVSTARAIELLESKPTAQAHTVACRSSTIFITDTRKPAAPQQSPLSVGERSVLHGTCTPAVIYCLVEHCEQYREQRMGTAGGRGVVFFGRAGRPHCEGWFLLVYQTWTPRALLPLARLPIKLSRPLAQGPPVKEGSAALDLGATGWMQNATALHEHPVSASSMAGQLPSRLSSTDDSSHQCVAQPMDQGLPLRASNSRPHHDPAVRVSRA